MFNTPTFEAVVNSPRVSVVIATFNRAPHLARALRALEHQTVPASEFEVVVADDGSTDDTAAVLAEAYVFRLRSLTQANQGPAAARNAAIALATGTFVLFIDDDVIPADDLVERHLAHHQQSGRAVFGRIAAPTGARQRVWTTWEMRTLEREYALMNAGVYDPTPRQFFTANASVRRTDLLGAGLFDVRFRRGEDVELAYRLSACGIQFHFGTDAVVFHDPPRSLHDWMRVAEQYGYYDVALWRDQHVNDVVRHAVDEFEHLRSPALRLAARVAVGRAPSMALVRVLGPLLIRVTSAVRASRASLAACSVVFNLLYWNAFAERLGGRGPFWRLMAPGQPQHDCSADSERPAAPAAQEN